MGADVVCADVLAWAASYDGPPAHALLCDPPYELNFMGKAWDKSGVAFQPATWAALAAHLLPGAFLMAFGGSRTYHRLACAVEDAGLIIHPAISYLFGSGFPKATRILSKEWEATDTPNPNHRGASQMINPYTEGLGQNGNITAPATPLAATWAGHRYGLQALKPAAEFILVAQKPYAGKPVSSIVETGAGSLWIDGARVATGDNLNGGAYCGNGRRDTLFGLGNSGREFQQPAGRWPSNVLLSHVSPDADGNGGCRRVGTRRVRSGTHTYRRDTSEAQQDDGLIYGTMEPQPAGKQIAYADADGRETVEEWLCADGCAVAELAAQSGESKSPNTYKRNAPGFNSGVYGQGMGEANGKESLNYGDSGTAARFFYQASWEYDVAERLAGVAPFFYCAKSSRAERDKGLEDSPQTIQRYVNNRRCKNCGRQQVSGSPCQCNEPDWEVITQPRIARNPHPTVKPLSLCKYLAGLLLPPAAYAPRRILVPFAGSGSEMVGALLAGWEDVLGVEREAEYVEIAQARLAYWAAQSVQAEMTL